MGTGLALLDARSSTHQLFDCHVRDEVEWQRLGRAHVGDNNLADCSRDLDAQFRYSLRFQPCRKVGFGFKVFAERVDQSTIYKGNERRWIYTLGAGDDKMPRHLPGPG